MVENEGEFIRSLPWRVASHVLHAAPHTPPLLLTPRQPRLERADVDDAECERHKAHDAGGKGELDQWPKPDEHVNAALSDAALRDDQGQERGDGEQRGEDDDAEAKARADGFKLGKCARCAIVV